MTVSSGADGVKTDIGHITAQLQALGISDIPTHEGVKFYPEYNPVDVYRAVIIKEVQRITKVESAIIDKALAYTQDLKYGDLVLPAAALRIKGRKPDELADEIASQFDMTLVQPPSVERGVVRFFFEPVALAKIVIPTIHKQQGDYGSNPNLGREDPADPTSRPRKVVVEYSSPNIAKEFHTGHLRSTIIGGFLTKLYERAGWATVSMNYLGDWGKQYGVLSEGFEKYGSEELLQQDPVKHLNDVYVKINRDSAEEQKPAKALAEKKEALEKLKVPPKPKKPAKGKAPEPAPAHEWTAEQEAELERATCELEKVQQELVDLPSIDEKARRFFKKMVDGDAQALQNWERFRQLSIDAYVDMYARLNITFDEYSGESTVAEKDMERAAQVLANKGISEDSKGAVIVDLAKHGAPALGKTLVKKRDGTSLYLTRDIAANFERYERYHFDLMIYVIANQQDLHVQQFFAILGLMGPPYSEIVARCKHVSFGMVKDPKGQTMSTRKGTVVSLADSLDSCKEYMLDVMRQNEDKFAAVEDPVGTADVLAISAIMVQDYHGKMINGYNFDMERMTSLEGDTGPYLQYSHTRLCGIKRKASVPAEEMRRADVGRVAHDQGAQLVRALAQWPDVFRKTYETHEPITVLTYLFRLAHLLSTVYEAEDARKAKTFSVMYATSAEEKAALMAMFEAARIVLHNGLRLLGLDPLERM